MVVFRLRCRHLPADVKMQIRCQQVHIRKEMALLSHFQPLPAPWLARTIPLSINMRGALRQISTGLATHEPAAA
ncbi:MAG: hypothetical protein JSS13_09610 [Proteobacteria bacterium]|jgi:hypothetical protein|nr:hypothetical protein [Pseudomonadota bacterium]HMM57801.1 hypothetical protein [Rudaea sp.]